jgi:hypothetical protein
MRRSYIVGGALLSLILGLGARPATAQVTLGADAALFSSYVWRGLSLTNKFVIQPDAYVSFPLGPTSLTVGGWANVEPSKYDDVPDDISEGGGLAGPDLTEFDWWAELGIPVGSVVTITPGATGYIYPNDGGLTEDNNTVEIYGKVSFATFLSPKLSVYYDVDKIKGAYIEASVSQGFPLTPALPLTLGALAGFSAGQEVNNSDPNELANFNESGLTHIDLSLSLPFSAGPLSIAPAFHFVINNDEFTKITKTNNSSFGFNQEDTKIWGGVTISWSHDFGGSEEAAE